MFDEDGPGPMPTALYVGGDIQFAGTKPVTGIAKWDGHEWSAVGDTLTSAFTAGGRPTVTSMLVFDDDGGGPNPSRLYISGNIARVGETGTNAPGVLRMIDGNWALIGAGARIRGAQALAIFDDDGPGLNPPALIVGGAFSTAYQSASPGFVLLNSVAKWTGTNWLPLGSGLHGGGAYVNSMHAWDPDGNGSAPASLFVGGRFDTAGSVTANSIARWDGVSWTDLAGGLSTGSNDRVYTIEAIDFDGDGPQQSKLAVGGVFTSAGPIASSSLALWDGVAWTDMAWPQAYEVFSIATFDSAGSTEGPTVYVGGSTSLSGNTFIRGLMKWDGGEWYDVSPNPSSLDVLSVIVADFDGIEGPNSPCIFAGGARRSASSDGRSSINCIARFDGNAWYKVGGAGRGFGANEIGSLRELQVVESGVLTKSLFAVGFFSNAGNNASLGIARWDGRSWRGIGGGLNSGARVVEAFDEDGDGPGQPELFVGGYFTQAGEVNTDYLAKWDGTNWHAFVEQPNSYVFSLQRFDPDGPGPARESLFVGGYFTSVGAMPASYVAQWDGTAWSSMGSGLNNWPSSMCVYDEDDDGPALPRLFVGGYFTTAGGIQVNGIARWDGSNWSEVGGGISSGGLVSWMTVFDEDDDGPIKPVLVVVGQFISAGGQNAAGIAAWNGSNWTPLATTTGSFARKAGAAGFDPDGPGPAPPELIVTDQFNTIQGISANSIARRLAGQWSTLGISPNDGINSLGIGIASFDDDEDGPNPPSLFVGGFQTMAGGLPSERISRWSAPVPFVRAYPDAIGAKVNERVELSLDVGGLTPITFQWYRDGSPLTDSGRISGSNSATLVIEPAYRGDSGQYELYASNQCGYGWSPAIDVGIGCLSARPDGDMDGDGFVDGHDIAAFVNILLFNSEPDETVCVADLNYDNILNADDIEPFASLLISQ